MFVSISLESLPDLPLNRAIEMAQDLDFTAIEVDIHDSGGHVQPSQLIAEPEATMQAMHFAHRLDVIAYSIELQTTGDAHYAQFLELCKFAKAAKVVTLVVPSAELGTPFNEEVEHLQRLVDLADSQGVRVAQRMQIGRLSEDPDTLMVLCDNVHGLGICYDPSVLIAGPGANKSVDRILKYVFHTHLRDTKADAFHVQVGQGEVDYAKLIQQLQKERYDRALGIHLPPLEGYDHRIELRKLRRLLESMV